MAEEEKKVSSKRAKKPASKKEKPTAAKQEAKQEVKQEVKQEAKQKPQAPVKKAEAKKEIVVGSIVSYNDKKLEVLSIRKNFAQLCLVDQQHKLFKISLRKLTLVK